MTTVVNIRHYPSLDYVYIGRARLDTDPEFKRRVEELRGKKLGCFCTPKPCHGDMIAAWLDWSER